MTYDTLQLSDPINRSKYPEKDRLEDLQHFIELGKLSASLLHEISGPLSVALINLDQLKSQKSVNIQQARRSLGLLRNYVESARLQLQHNQQVGKDFCIYPHIMQLKRLLQPYARSSGVSLVFENAVHYRLNGDPVKFQQILANLIINAVDAYETDGDHNLEKPIRVCISGKSRLLNITVSDWGIGIPANQLERVFEPFFTTKSHGQHGLGIGLTIVKEHVSNVFQGSIAVTCTSRGGTKFALSLPALPCPKTDARKMNVIYKPETT